MNSSGQSDKRGPEVTGRGIELYIARVSFISIDEYGSIGSGNSVCLEKAL